MGTCGLAADWQAMLYVPMKQSIGSMWVVIWLACYASGADETNMSKRHTQRTLTASDDPTGIPDLQSKYRA